MNAPKGRPDCGFDNEFCVSPGVKISLSFWSIFNLYFVLSVMSFQDLARVVQRLDNAIQRISVNKTNHAIQRLNNPKFSPFGLRKKFKFLCRTIHLKFLNENAKL